MDLGDTQSYRLRANLLDITDPSELVIRLRDRATVTTWSGHRSVRDRVRGELVSPGRQRLGLVEDAATSLDPRERGVGEQTLARRLELFRENARR